MKIYLKQSVIISVVVATAIGVSGFYVGEHIQYTQDVSVFNTIHPVREQGTLYTLISPLLGYSIPSDLSQNEYSSRLMLVQSVINNAKKSGDIDNVSVYYRDLNTNHWFGVDQAHQYYPASLLKVPIMIAYFQKAEKNPSILRHLLTLVPLPANQSTEFDNPSVLISGKAYSVSRLIQAMITESDNGAMATLFSYLNSVDAKALDDVYGNLGIQGPDDNSSANYQISARVYGWFFRILYNATYISPELSEKALGLLSEATFKDGIVDGVPSGITVAHKYGEHIITDGTVVSAVQMHDCGVVYAKEGPYLLCVMTQTKSEEASTKLIQDISRIIYLDVSKGK